MFEDQGHRSKFRIRGGNSATAEMADSGVARAGKTP